MNCRHCSAPLEVVFSDLGLSPLCESFVYPEKVNEGESFFPLKVWVCTSCWLVQLDEFVSPSEIFHDYAYFSSYSDSWLKHAKRYVDYMISDFGINKNSFVVELASNDGYLLQYFVQQGIPCLGIEPAENVAQVAINIGVPSISKFFGKQTAQEILADKGQADLILGNNVLAHVPDINDFVGGVTILLAPDGIVTYEFPHLFTLIDQNQFDTIYHEHFSYLSLTAVQAVFATAGLRVFHVEELPSHGGSLRVFGCHAASSAHEERPTVHALLKREHDLGVFQVAMYQQFNDKVMRTKRLALAELIRLKDQGKKIAGYGAPGKGNTFLNYCGISVDFLSFTVDKNPFKHGKFLPGSRIPIFDVDKIMEEKPDYILILPWNLKKEIAAQLAYTQAWGCKLLVAIPHMQEV